MHALRLLTFGAPRNSEYSACVRHEENIQFFRFGRWELKGTVVFLAKTSSIMLVTAASMLTNACL
jgi:hypothetical protein